VQHELGGACTGDLMTAVAHIGTAAESGDQYESIGLSA
jgi:hypothetical protein